jgi:SAM-dependent methyltransferase
VNHNISFEIVEYQRNYLGITSPLQPLLKPEAKIDWSQSIPTDLAMRRSEGIEAHHRYFNNREWRENYFKYVHRDRPFKDRWTAALGDVRDKVVIEIGCGPGNVFSTLGSNPKSLIGIDVAAGALEHARIIGYEPLLADAHDLPLASNVADIVILNAALHHCEHMGRVLEEAARLVARGGLLVTDHDPQQSAYAFRGPGKWLWDARLTFYHLIKKGYHSSCEEQAAVLASELHHRPGDGVTREFFETVLRPLGFEVQVFPHNHGVGAEVLNGQSGTSAFKYRALQILSGMNPYTPQAALSLMCLARLPLRGTRDAAHDG